MKILLISPFRDSEHRTNKGLMMPQLSLFIIEGLTPKEHEVKIVEEECMTLDINEECDLVGISAMTSTAPRAYYLANEFKKRGKTVILGGVHPSILPDESLEYADAVVIGEAEGVWEQLLKDFQNGGLKKKYCNHEPDLSNYVPKNFASLKSRRLYNLIPIMTTRGCPYNCPFCSVTNLFGKKVRHIPIENIVRDIKESGAKTFLFLDDNIIGNVKYAKELFKAIKPLKINWMGQASISFVKDVELMQLASESGCKILFIGFESVCEEQMKTMKKSIKELKDLELAIKKIKKFGILIHASIIFGFDSDTKKTFQDTLDFLIKNKVSTVSFNILTPYPGTQVFEEFQEQGRLLTKDWKYYDHNTVVFRPKNMTPFELQTGKAQTRKKFYTYSSVFKRLFGNMYRPDVFLITNYGHIKQAKVEVKRLSTLKTELFQESHN